MDRSIKNVDVDVKANVYFGGNVTSRKITSSNDEVMTLGIILPGEYEFSVDDKETVDLIAGNAEVLLPDEKEWIKINQGQNFIVIANSNYKIKTDEIVEYLCTYVK